MKKVFFVLIVLLTGFSSFAQNQNDRFVDRLRFGGNLGLSFGSVTYIDVSPMVGYQATDRWMLGLGASYIYYKFNSNTVVIPDQETTWWGGRHFQQFNITPQLFAWGEFELLNGEVYDPFDQLYKRQWIENLLVGGGYRSGPVMVTALYNVSYQSGNGFYNSPWVFRVGVFL